MIIEPEIERLNMQFKNTFYMIMKKRQKTVCNVSIALLVSYFAFYGCSYMNKTTNLEDDHFMEEIAEDILRHHTGIDLDFSPDTAEN